MSYIQTYEDDIVNTLKYGFGEKQPHISADMNYEDAGDEKKILERAKLYASSKNNGGAIFVGYTGKSFDAIGTGGAKMTKTDYMFIVMLFCTNRRKTTQSHLDIYDMIETSELALWKAGYKLYNDTNIPVKIDQTGLYRSTIIASIYKPYPSEL